MDTILNKRLSALEQKQDRVSGFDPPGRWYELLAAPTCPPSRQITIRGGTVTANPNWGFIMQGDFVPDMTCDLENVEETGLPLIFRHANYYLPVILCYGYYWVARHALGGDYADPPYFDCLVGTEVETSALAEAQIDAWLNGYTQWYIEVLPLCGVILKNNGMTDSLYAILPVDHVNRGRSYLYRDARIRFNISG